MEWRAEGMDVYTTCRCSGVPFLLARAVDFPNIILLRWIAVSNFLTLWSASGYSSRNLRSSESHLVSEGQTHTLKLKNRGRNDSRFICLGNPLSLHTLWGKSSLVLLGIPCMRPVFQCGKAWNWITLIPLFNCLPPSIRSSWKISNQQPWGDWRHRWQWAAALTILIKVCACFKLGSGNLTGWWAGPLVRRFVMNICVLGFSGHWLQSWGPCINRQLRDHVRYQAKFSVHCCCHFTDLCSCDRI